MTITNEHLIQEEIKRRLNSGNACYHSVPNLLPSHMLSKNIKVRIYKTVIEETGGWRKLHNEELNNLYSSPRIIRIIKSRRMRWAEHVARMGEIRNA
jgi:hypothetical protein